MKISAVLVFILLLAWLPSYAQEGAINTEWLEKDLQNVKLLSHVLPIETQTVERLSQIFGRTGKYDSDGKDYGFGFKGHRFDKPGGYTRFTINAFFFNDALAQYTIGVSSGGSEHWPLIKESLAVAWRQNGGPEYQETESGFFYKISFSQVFQTHKSFVASELGEMKPIKVPDELQEYYEHLIEATRNSTVGIGPCDYGGVIRYGKRAIDALLEAKRIDLIENVLRGYNPGGRVYAALALMKLQRQGVKLSDETKSLIAKVKSLEVAIEVCRGCEHEDKRADEILSSAEFEIK